MLTTFLLILAALVVFATRKARPERPTIPVAHPGHHGEVIEGARLRTAHAATVLTARAQAIRFTGLNESVSLTRHP